MSFSTRRYLLPPRLPGLLALSLATLLATGCQSTKPSFSFQPTAQAVSLTEEKEATPTLAEPGAAKTSAPAAAQQANPQSRRPPRMRKQLRPRLVAAVAHQAVRAVVAHRRPVLARPRATAEAGLGTTVFGLLGLVAIPVGLVGLAFGGGLVWGIIAAAGGLALLVAYLDSGR